MFTKHVLLMLALGTTTRAAEWIVTGSTPPELHTREVVIVTTPDFKRYLFQPGDDIHIDTPAPLRSLLVTAEGYQARQIHCRYDAATRRFALGPLDLARQEAVLTLPTMTVSDPHATALSIPVADVKPRDLLGQAGADGSIAKALQRLPGVSTPDQGSGLYIRGGNANETLVLVNGAALSSPDRELAPLGNLTSMINGESVDSVQLRTANISARYGNVLSGVVDLNTDRQVEHDEADASLSLAGASAHLDHRMGRLTASLTTSYDSTRVLERNYGRGQPFATYPWTAENNLSFVYAAGAVRTSLFALARQSALAVAYATPYFSGVYTERQARTFLSSQTSITLGAGDTLKLQLGDDRNTKHTGFGGAHGDVRTRNDELHVSDRHTFTDLIHLEGGLDYGISRFAGTSLYGSAGNSSTTAPSRRGGYLEGDLGTKSGWLAAAGLRVDEDSYARRAYLSPRVSVRREIANWSAYVSGGIFHQTLDPERASQLTDPAWLATARMDTVSAGISWKDKRTLLSLEVYHKTYHDLVDYTADRRSLEGGLSQTVSGLDLAAARDLWPGAVLRSTLSLLRSDRRNDRDGTYPADTDIPVTFDLRLTQNLFARTFHVEVAYSYWSGAPFTHFTGVNYTNGELYYGARNGARYPSRTHVTFSLYNIFRLHRNWYLIPELSGDNLLNRLDATSARYGSNWDVTGYDGTNLRRNLFLGIVIAYE